MILDWIKRQSISGGIYKKSEDIKSSFFAKKKENRVTRSVFLNVAQFCDFCLFELYHELFKSKCQRLTKNNLIKLIKILDHHYLNYNFENLYSLL